MDRCLSSYSLNKKDTANNGFSFSNSSQTLDFDLKKDMIEGDEREKNRVCCTFLLMATAWAD